MDRIRGYSLVTNANSAMAATTSWSLIARYYDSCVWKGREGAVMYTGKIQMVGGMKWEREDFDIEWEENERYIHTYVGGRRRSA